MPDRLLSRVAADDDAGFSLVEVIVALVLLGVAALATLPVLLLGQQATSASRDRTVAKNLAQEQVETLRNLPYFVSYANQPGGADVDLLDTYYPRLTPALADGFPLTATGFVSAAVTVRPAGDPVSGAYYRRHEPLPAPYARFARTTVLQFQVPDAAGTTNAAAVPGATYDSDVVGRDLPPSKLVGTTVVVHWRSTAGDVRHTVTSQIGASDSTTGTAGQVLTGQTLSGLGRAQAVSIVGHADKSETYVTAGTAQADGASGLQSSAGASTESAAMAITGLKPDALGARNAVAAPTGAQSTMSTIAVGPVSGSDGSLNCRYGCFGPGFADAQWASVEAGLPLVRAGGGLPTDGVRARLVGRGAGPTTARASKVFAISGDPEPVHSGLDLAYPYADYGVMTMTGGATGTDAAVGTANVVTTTGASKGVTVTVRAMSSPVDVVPTGFTRSAGGGGLLQVSVDAASLECKATAGGTPTASGTYSGRIRYWAKQGTTGYGYSETQFSFNGTALTTTGAPLPDPSGVVVREVTTTSKGVSTTVPRFLSEYVRSIELAPAIELAVDPVTGAVRASLLPLSVRTTALKDGDPLSTWSIELGALSCSAQDSR